ncbi:MAG: homoserine O-acetyltransferase, partial [Pseudomonadota bacterium]
MSGSLDQLEPGAVASADAADGTGATSAKVSETIPPVPHEAAVFASKTGLDLESGERLAEFDLSYNTYGTLNADKSNAVLVCHALTGDQHVANTHPVTGKPGWWWRVVGPGRPIDTDRYFVICAN